MPMKPLRALVSGVAIAVLCTLGAATAASAAPSVSASSRAEPVRIAIVMPMTVPDGGTGFISAGALAAYTSPTGVLTRQLDEVIGGSVAIGIDPMILASIRVLGSTAPPSAVEWLARLEGSSNATFALGYADSDVTAPLQADSRAVLEPQSLEYAIDPALFAPAPDATTGTSTDAAGPTAVPTPTATGSPIDAPPLPTTDSLLDFPYTLPGISWPVADTVTKRDLTRISTSGYTTTILDSTNVKRSDETSAVARISSSRVLVSDSAVSALMRETVASVASDAWLDSVSRLKRSITAQAGGSTVLVTLDRTNPSGFSRLADTVSQLSSMRNTQLVSLSGLGTEPQATATIINKAQSKGRLSAVSRLLGIERQDARFASIAEDPSLITGERRILLLSALSPAPNRHPGGFGTSVEAFETSSRKLHQSVRLVKSSEITLLADRASVYVAVRNDLDQPITVYVAMRPLSPLLRVEDSHVEVTVAPESQKNGQVPVQSLSNGEVELAVDLTSEIGVRVSPTTYVRINVQAGWEGPTTFVIGAAVVIIFGLGIYRNIIRRRRPVRPSPELPTVE